MDGEALEFPVVVDEGQRAFAQQLHRAGELLRDERLPEAEMQILEAMQVRPDDARARNLLGLVYFRAARYDAAFQVYEALVADEPDDLALRLNLGLVELRMGRHAEAAAELKRVVVAEPGNQKAQGYYGLALMRSGDLPGAHAAFVAAGQEDLARQVAEQLAEPRRLSGAASVDAAAAGGAPVEAAPAEDVSLDAFADVGNPMHRALSGSKTQAGAPQPLAAFIATRELRPPSAADSFSLTDGGLLVARVAGRLPTRITGALASSGRLAYAPLARRVRGSHTHEVFGDGDDSMCLATGSGVMVLSPRGGRFSVLALHDDAIYLREGAVFAFEETLSWENGRIPGSGGVRFVQFRGDGRVVMRAEKTPYTLRLTTGEVIYADQDALLGWTGLVVPQQLRSADGDPSPYVSCNGEGALILIDPAEPPSPGLPSPSEPKTS